MMSTYEEQERSFIQKITVVDRRGEWVKNDQKLPEVTSNTFDIGNHIK